MTLVSTRYIRTRCRVRNRGGVPDLLLQADIRAVGALRPRSDIDEANLAVLKDFLAIVAGFEERATTRTQADYFATNLRQFLGRRDATAASAWAGTQ